MGEFIRNNKKMLMGLLGCIAVIWSFYFIDKGFFMDEAGVLSIYRGIYQGKRMFVDEWGYIQSGSILAYPIFALYYNFLEPLIYPLGIGFILYTRILYQLVRLIIAIFIYATIRKTHYKDGALLTAIVYYMLFISYRNFSYKSFCEFGIALFICFGIRYFLTENNIYFSLMGIATCISILGYPTMILFPFVFVIAMLVMQRKGFKIGKGIVIYTVTCFTIGGLVLGFLQVTSGLTNILSQFQYMEDSDYSEPSYIRMGKMVASYLIFFATAYLPIILFAVIRKYRYLSKSLEYRILSIYWIIFMVGICLIRVESISNSRFVYASLIIFWWYLYIVKENTNSEKTEYTTIGKFSLPQFQEKEILYFVFWVSLACQLIWAFSTNQGIAVSGLMSYPVVLAMICIADVGGKGFDVLKWAVTMTSFFFMGIWVAESNGGYNDIFEHRTYVTEGAYRGIALDDTDYPMNQACYDLLTENVTEDDYLLVTFGSNSTAYLNTDAHQGVGSAYTRTHINDRLLQYWELNPENKADYVLIDTASPKYEVFQDSASAEYIYEEYPTVVDEEGSFILLGR